MPLPYTSLWPSAQSNADVFDSAYGTFLVIPNWERWLRGATLTICIREMAELSFGQGTGYPDILVWCFPSVFLRKFLASTLDENSICARKDRGSHRHVRGAFISEPASNCGPWTGSPLPRDEILKLTLRVSGTSTCALRCLLLFTSYSRSMR